MTPRILRTALATLIATISIFAATRSSAQTTAPTTPSPAPAPRSTTSNPATTAPLTTNPYATPTTATSTSLPATVAQNTAASATTQLTPAGNPNERITLNWTALPLSMAIPKIEKLTGRTIIRPATLANVADLTLTFTNQPTRSEALQGIETLLAVNQLALIPLGDKFLKLVPINAVRSEAPTFIEGSTLDLAPSGRVATKLFQLEFLRCDEFVQTLPTMLNAQIQTISIFQRSNAILITDSVSTLQRIEMLLKQVDKPAGTPIQTKFYSLEYSKASDLVNKIRTIFQGPLQMQLGASTSFNADDRTNQFVVIGDPRQFSIFDDLVKKLDVKADPNTRNEVIRLKTAVCTDVATLLGSVISGQTRAAQTAQAAGGATTGQRQTAGQNNLQGQTRNVNAQGAQGTQNNPNRNTRATMQQAGGTATPAIAAGGTITGSDLGLNGNEFSSFVTVQPDARTNSIVVSGTVDDVRIIKELVEKLDVLLAQVRIEVVIAEVSLSDEASSGIDSLGLNVVDGKLVGIGASGAGFNFGATGTSGFGVITPSLTSVISLSSTPRKNNTNIVSVPAITTMHNKDGKIFVGETRPVITASTVNTIGTGNPTTSSVTQMEIGTTITVKPLIGYDGSVQLEIQQEISDVSGEVKIDNNTQYIIGKRNTTSTVIVKSGEIIVLGGIQKNSNSKTTSRLGPIPFIGDLLGGRKRSQNRTELIFFLRPTVLTNSASDNVPAYQQLDKMSNKEEVQKALGQTPTPPSSDASSPSVTTATSTKESPTGSLLQYQKR